MNQDYQRMTGARVFAAYLGETKWEFIKMIRNPMFAVPTLFFPVMYYLLFAVLLYKGTADGAVQILVRMGVFGVMAPGLFGFGVALAFEREYGLLQFKQALPMPPGSYLLARMAMAMIFASIISLLMIVLAKFAGHVPFGFVQGLEIYVTGVLGVLPFCALGLCVGAYVSGQAAPAIVNVIYLPMAFLSGLWVPMPILPHVLQQLAPVWPAFHLAQLQLDTLGAPSMGTFASHVASLAGFTIVFFTIAMRRLATGGLRMFGGGNGAPKAGLSVAGLLSRAVFFGGIGLIIAGVLGGTVAKAPTDAAGPVGIAAPAEPLIASFDDGTLEASYGVGWEVADDKSRGGNSSSTLQLIAGGAGQSKGALEASGTIRDAIQYPFGGTIFFPKGTDAGAFMDYSSKKTLRFQARGDGRQITVIFLVGNESGGIPPMYSFAAGPEWQEVRIALDTLAGMDLKRVRAIVIGAAGPPGDFRFAIDDVRIE
jgi:ABC-2 type transport system permease protein